MGEFMKNNIIKLQDNEPQLKLLRARTKTYKMATLLMLIQLSLTVILPILGTLLTVFAPEARPFVAAGALVVLLLDISILDRTQKRLLKRAAKICEEFDCIVLQIPWNHFLVGEAVDNEDIHRAATSYSHRHNDEALRGWYPEAVAKAPLHLARLICQRTNLRYDSQLRRNYSSVILISIMLVFAGFLIVGLVQNLTVIEWVLSLTSATPVLSWALREFYRHRDTADQLEELMRAAKKLWDRASAGEVDPETCAISAREFQDAIYSKRVTSPLIIPLVYRLSRPRLEDEMNAAATDFLKSFLEQKSIK